MPTSDDVPQDWSQHRHWIGSTQGPPIVEEPIIDPDAGPPFLDEPIVDANAPSATSDDIPQDWSQHRQ